MRPHFLLETAWVATFARGAGGRTLGVNSEMDALPGIGHACGHNLIAISGVAVACAVRAVMEELDIAGKVVLLGTPGEFVLGWWCGRVLNIGAAEEGGYGKVRLLNKGAYEEMDVCLMWVPWNPLVAYKQVFTVACTGATPPPVLRPRRA